MEESEVTSNEMMRDTGSLVQYVDLAVENVLGLFVCVLRDVAGGSCLDAVEAGGQVGWGVCSFGLDAEGGLDGLEMKLRQLQNKGTYEWKSATIALSPSGMGMNSLPAPLMMVRGTAFGDTEVVVSKHSLGSART
jgi:hypothetical protein